MGGGLAIMFKPVLLLFQGLGAGRTSLFHALCFFVVGFTFIGAGSIAAPAGKDPGGQATAAPNRKGVNERTALGKNSSGRNLAAASETSHAKSILIAAKDSVGKEMWKGFGLPNGGLGCAASLSNVLGKAGVKYARSPVTKVVRQKLLGGPYKTAEYVVKEGGDGAINDRTLAKVAQPGDVLVAFMDPLPKGNIGPKAHCGIIGSDGTVFTNDWNDGIWKHADIHTYFDSYRHIRVIRVL
jgi:hypothetical protein